MLSLVSSDKLLTLHFFNAPFKDQDSARIWRFREKAQDRMEIR